MCFEIKDRDLAGKIGILKTRRGNIETPYVMPVVNPIRNIINPSELISEFKLNMIITNSYIIMKHYGIEAKDVHEITGFHGVIMTDSGAYQLLIYGRIDVKPEEILKFQEKIKSDIGVILDVPTGGYADRQEAEYTVMETLRRAKESIALRNDKSMLWAGPIQGGRFLDLIEKSAEEMGKLDFHIHPLGSPTQIMEDYDYKTLIDMIVIAKRKLPPERPFHLFGAGHPMMLSLAVALGCDLFDSAAYALFAKDGRYMTQSGTLRIEDLNELPCNCPICSKYDVKYIMEIERSERELLLAKHNLYMVIEEIKIIKEAIREGRLWELLEIRCRSHPKLYEGFKRLSRYSKYLEEQDPIISRRGIFFYDQIAINRPEVIRYKRIFDERYEKPEGKEVLLLLPMPKDKPFNKSKIFKEAFKLVEERVHICFYGDPFGIVPVELSETFPLSQFESSMEDSKGWREDIKKFARNYREIIILGEEVEGFKSIKSIGELKVK
ncbi:MAG: tRNA guanosine(15) transglycosylase TgtA [Candidatus Methanomethyliaceae archaeon]|nr:tRNA guanosine(15) transglycosylase TgtA [Candidatus Methanomethyliaceae archaeon]MDW7971503.1 tRNA guanosine(15) transglycosylase TgtA [Nitrososphaerota archaeon]